MAPGGSHEALARRRGEGGAHIRVNMQWIEAKFVFFPFFVLYFSLTWRIGVSPRHAHVLSPIQPREIG